MRKSTRFSVVQMENEVRNKREGERREIGKGKEGWK